MLSRAYLCRGFSTSLRLFKAPRVPRGLKSADKISEIEKIPDAKPLVHRVSYEYPPPPKLAPQAPKESSAWRRHMPVFIGVGSIVWVACAYYYLFGSHESEQAVLSPDKFSKFRLTYREQISPDLVLIELSPKYAAHVEILTAGGTLWNGQRLWSVQIKHPDIQIARKYTPLPLYYMQKHGDSNVSPLLRLMGDNEEEGRLVFLIKKYGDGEMSRYLHSLPIGADVELRGPYVEHKFPYAKADMSPPRHPMLDIPSRLPADVSPETTPHNIAFFTAGTGLAPALQALFSVNPPRGMTTVYHSVRTRTDIPLSRFLLFLEKTGRAKFKFFVDDENKMLTLSDIPDPQTHQDRVIERSSHKYHNALAQYADQPVGQYLPGPTLAVVCGPPGYIAHVAGNPGLNNEQPIGGLLGHKNWTKINTARLIEW